MFCWIINVGSIQGIESKVKSWFDDNPSKFIS